MKQFKQFLSEVEKDNQLAKSVIRTGKDSHTKNKQIASLHYKHGVDYDVFQADSHDLAYFGKGVVRLVGKTTGAESVAYVDWKAGTVRFNSHDAQDDKKFDHAVKFKTASLYESLDSIEEMDNLAEQFQLNDNK